MIADAVRLAGGGALDVGDPKALAACVLHTCYMGTGHSSAATRSRALALASEVGPSHCCAPCRRNFKALHV